MNRIWAVFRSYPYTANVVGYTTLFATADLIQQSMLGGTHHEQSTHLSGETSEQETSVTSRDAHVAEEQNSSVTATVVPVHSIDWSQTFRVALIGFCFNSNFNYHWLRALEKRFPGGDAKVIFVKVFLDQLVAAPATISVFYIGEYETVWTKHKSSPVLMTGEKNE